MHRAWPLLWTLSLFFTAAAFVFVGVGMRGDPPRQASVVELDWEFNEMPAAQPVEEPVPVPDAARAGARDRSAPPAAARAHAALPATAVASALEFTVTPRPTPRKPAAAVREQPVAAALSAEPQEIEVAPATVPPVVVAAPVPDVPAQASHTAALSGRLTRPSGDAPAGVAVSLIEIGTLESQQTTTDSKGAFSFSGLRVGGLYYVVATVEVAAPALRWDYQYGFDGSRRRYGYVLTPRAGQVARGLSWHQAVTLERAASYAIELSPDNADAEYSTEIQPTNDPLARTPYRSWRHAVVTAL